MPKALLALSALLLAQLACGGGGGGGAAAGPSTGTPAPTPGSAQVTFTVDSTQGTRAISPYIYGTNQGDFSAEARGLTLSRMGGNRLTAYDWETNASNAGSDWQYENDDYMSASATPGLPMLQSAQAAAAAGASLIMTVPMAGWVAADEAGPCPAQPTPAQIAQRFLPILPAKGAAFSYPPNLTDGKVYADEFVAWLESQFPTAQTDPARRIFYMLDNEPDLWSSTHSEIHPAATTYAELAQKSTALASAIKAAAPGALVFGPVSYGWEGFLTLQNAPDAAGRDFLDFYLDTLQAAESGAGKRLLDVLDVHWYPEATGGGARITDDGVSEAEVEARLQAPRSLWDPSYTETSWITQWSTQGPIALIPRLQAKIDQHYPGTRLSISEYNYGAGGDISGGLAQADVLGVFGQQGLFAAALWELDSDSSYLFAAFRMYRDYDGRGGAFGDTAISAQSSDVATATVYASIQAASPSQVILVAINKTTSAQTAAIALTHPVPLTTADVYTLTAAGAAPATGPALAADGANHFTYAMPARSVSTLVLHP